MKILLLLTILSSNILFANSPQLIVNIDNPNFRKLVIALPDFKVSDSSDERLNNLAKEGSLELGRLLNYSGLFNIMGKAAYKDILNRPVPQAIKGLEGVDAVQWKAIGVESLTIGELARDGTNYSITFRTVDVYRKQLLIGKRYRSIKAEDFKSVIRKYADRILEAYTGKPGIFSSKIVFIGRQIKNSFKQVYICDFDGSNVQQITDGNYPHLSPSFSRDGRFITFTSYRDGNPDLFQYELSTKKMRKLSGRKGLNSGSNWSHNDKLVAFTGSQNGDADIFVISPNEKNSRALIRGSGLDVDPTFSPNGRWLAFVSGRFGKPHIFLATLKWESDTLLKVVSDKRLTYAGWYNATPAWAPESDKIAFAGYDRDTDRFDLFMMNPDGTNLERLTIRVGDNERPNWSPNGQMLVFQSNRTRGRDIKGQFQLYIMNRDGSGQRPINTNLYEAQTPHWGPQLK